jgi:hypothetical protein
MKRWLGQEMSSNSATVEKNKALHFEDGLPAASYQE